jgi:hypothetical protein
MGGYDVVRIVDFESGIEKEWIIIWIHGRILLFRIVHFV